ncbi:PhzF family phenazine biosynthesis protein [Endozoicomonas arenosclerae]|uniref:PhzF family phenazine biosynthesis protein n=1 Tax=Endozoicomonas arenosclerae TaxID=1633495 RepID=UPI000784E4A3|nr:PhzF family phenazine biosynthesis protein [Endozoicomonas arenosclerae]
MKQLPIYQVDAFTQQLFGGNPAAICPVEEDLSEELMQSIALENNLSETAFIRGAQGHYHIRWFTPGTEVSLCGHATVAASYIIRHELGDRSEELSFESLSGVLKVRFIDDLIELDFPAASFTQEPVPEEVAKELPFQPVDSRFNRDDLLIVAPDEQTVSQLDLDFTVLENSRVRGVVISARSERAGVDFVSRWFGGPEVAIKEDPVTGSAHTMLAPYWSEQLDKKVLTAEQISQRKGYLECEWQDSRVLIRGNAVLYMRGQITLPGGST